MAGEVKGFLFAWIGKNMKVRPDFRLDENGGAHRFNFQVYIAIYITYI